MSSASAISKSPLSKISSIIPDQPLSLASISIEHNPEHQMPQINEENQVNLQIQDNHEDPLQSQSLDENMQNLENSQNNQNGRNLNANLDFINEEGSKNGIASTFWVFWLLHVFFIILFVCYLWELHAFIIVAYFWGLDFCFIKANLCYLLTNRGYTKNLNFKSLF